MDEESEEYKPSAFLKNNRDFLKGYCFKFEGLSEECERGFTHIVKELGGQISKKAKHTLVEKKYFEKDENKKREDLYHINFILDSLDFGKLLDIKLYRCSKSCTENEKSPIYQNRINNDNNGNIDNTTVRNNDSNESNSDDDVLIPHKVAQSKSKSNGETFNTNISKAQRKSCKGITKSNSNIDTFTANNNSSNESNSDDDTPVLKKIAQSRSQINGKTLNTNISKVQRTVCKGIASISNNSSNESNSNDDTPVLKNVMQSRSQSHGKTLNTNIATNSSNVNNAIVNNNSSNESNSDDDLPISEMMKKSKLHCNDKILKKNISKVKKRKLYTASRSDNESSSSSYETVKVKAEPKSSDFSESDSEVTIKITGNIKSEASSSSDESTNYETDSEPVVRKRIKNESNLTAQINRQNTVPQNKTNAKVTKRTWVDTKNIENNRAKNNVGKNNTKEKNLPSSSRNNTGEKNLPSSSEVHWSKSKIEERDDLKWLFHLDKNDLCQIKNCTFEPGPHDRHYYAGRVISDEEKKIILKYLIKNKLINRAKGIKTWERMICDGYLTHRSADTLRNCMRRVILPSICKFNLPTDILDEFFLLDEKKTKGNILGWNKSD